MARASSMKFGAGQQDQGKGDGSGGMSPDTAGNLPENAVLSNRDTARHSRQRGHDGAHVQTEQYHDHPGNREGTGAEDLPDDLADERPDERPAGGRAGGQDGER